MKLPVQKNFRLMKLLNHDHGPIMRGLAASLAYVGIIVATGRPILATELAGCFWTKRDFKLGARRGAWYYRRAWLRLDVPEDELFDPTEGMSDRQLAALDAFIAARKAHLTPANYAADSAFVAARRLDNNSDPQALETNMTAFKARCDLLLSYAGTHIPAKLKPSAPRAGDFPVTDAQQALGDFLALFPLATMPWFLVSGTFLGLIRENGFLAHDYDIDLGIFEDQIDIEAACAAILASDQFELKKYHHHQSNLYRPDVVSTNADIPYILKIVHVSGIHLDLFIHYRDTSTDPASYWHGSMLHRWDNVAFELIPYTLCGFDVLGPADFDTYLTENYGDWRTPVTEFNCSTDTPNLALVPHPIAVVIFLKRYVFNTSFDPKGADQVLAELMANGFVVNDPAGTLQFSGDIFAR